MRFTWFCEMSKPIRPSSVEKWTRCQMLWLREDVQGYRRPIVAHNPAQFLGTALHAGMADYWLGRQGGEAEPRRKALETLVDLWPISEVHSFEGMAQLLNRVLDATITHCALHMRTEDAIMIEEPLGEDGHTTPDLVTRGFNPDLKQGLVITDYKFHLEVKPEHVVYRLQDPDHSHQFQHYTWAIQEKFKEPVKLFRALHIVGLPKVIVRETTFVPSEAQTAHWLAQARRKWHLMEMMRLDPQLAFRNENGCKPYGDKYPCPQWEGCWTCHGDEEMMTNFYVKEPK